MIKTKTPRHWGGIRQVSPPMLTSRLSNIGRWRTNGCKDFRPSDSKYGWELQHDDYRSEYAKLPNVYNFKHSVYSKSTYVCPRQDRKRNVNHYNQTNAREPNHGSHSMGDRFYCNQNQLGWRLAFRNSRLTLKGVA